MGSANHCTSTNAIKLHSTPLLARPQQPVAAGKLIASSVEWAHNSAGRDSDAKSEMSFASAGSSSLPANGGGGESSKGPPDNYLFQPLPAPTSGRNTAAHEARKSESGSAFESEALAPSSTADGDQAQRWNDVLQH